LPLALWRTGPDAEQNGESIPVIDAMIVFEKLEEPDNRLVTA
jgi:hypothetical protein